MTNETNNNGTSKQNPTSFRDEPTRSYRETEQEGTVEATTTTHKAGSNSGKSRIVLVVVGVLALGGLVILGSKFTSKPTGTGSQSQVGEAPQVKNIPGSSNDSRYNQLQQDVNAEASAEAKKHNGTYIPVPTGNSDNGTKDPYDALNNHKPKPEENHPEQNQVQVPVITPQTPVVYQPQPQPQVQQNTQQDQALSKSYSDQMGTFLGAWSYNKDSIFTEYDTTGKSRALASSSTETNDTSSTNSGEVNASGQPSAPKPPVIRGANVGNAGSSVATSTPSQGADASGSSVAQTTQVSQPTTEKVKGATFVHAGVIVPVDIVTPVNTDYPGPVRAIVTAGPLKGSIILAEPARVNDSMTIRASSISIPGQPSSFAINGVMTDAADAAPYMSTSVNRHTFKRYTLLSLAALARGYGQAVSRENSTVTQNPLGGVTTTYGSVNNKQIIGMAVGNLGQTVAQDLQNNAQQPPTVKLQGEKGEPFHFPAGLLFLNDF